MSAYDKIPSTYRWGEPVFWYDDDGNKVTGTVYHNYHKYGILDIHPDYEPEGAGLLCFKNAAIREGFLHRVRTPKKVLSKNHTHTTVFYSIHA